ncbi:hypothetical protein DFH27DRAFT_522666 [Peziza echinospora]|nr:hypothetical protein DFH27DRAFT_522666 [Peziza echinospora]
MLAAARPAQVLVWWAVSWAGANAPPTRDYRIRDEEAGQPASAFVPAWLAMARSCDPLFPRQTSLCTSSTSSSAPPHRIEHQESKGNIYGRRLAMPYIMHTQQMHAAQCGKDRRGPLV